MHNRFLDNQRFFQNRRWLGAAAAVVLAATGFAGLRAAEHEINPPATVKVTTRTESAARHGYSAVVKEVVPAVVNISSTKLVKQAAQGAEMPDDFFRQFFGDQFGEGGQQFGNRGGSHQFNVPQERREKGLGSGVIVSPEGYILTNNHVVDGANEVVVTLHDKREFKARVIGTDPRTDIAVIKIDGSNFPVLTLADSSRVEVGDVVLAVGDPFGVGQTVTQGIVSATGRSGLGIEDVEDFIQTDASINPGNSGGALVDDEGHLVGINTAIIGNSGGNVGIGFAVPINMAKHDMDSILAHGKVERGYLGIYPENVTPALAKAFHSGTGGALIGDVTAGSPAANAGLKKGDIVTDINGAPIADANQLRLKVGMMEPNSRVSMKVLRDGKPMDVAVQLGAYPTAEEHASAVTPDSDATSSLKGVTVQSLTPEIAQQLKIPPSTKGVVVSNVSPASDAAEAGLQQGDVIQEVNRQPITSASEFNHALSGGKDNPVLLLVNRGGNTTYVAIS